MEKVYLFDSVVPYKWVRQAFRKAVGEYLPCKREIQNVGIWRDYLSYLANYEKSYIVDRDSNIYLKEIPTYLDFQAIPNRVFLYLYDGIDEVKRDVRVFDDYPICGIVIPPDIYESKDEIVEGLAKFIKTVVDLHIALENAKNHIPGS